MFNFIATALMTHLLVNVLIKPGQQSPETREFAPSTWLPQLHDVARALGWEIGGRRYETVLPTTALTALARSERPELPGQDTMREVVSVAYALNGVSR